MKRYGQPEVIVADKLRSYGAAMKPVGNAGRQETGRWLNNRADNSHLPFQRREWAILRFRKMRPLQKFVTVHASVHNHVTQERKLYSRGNFKLNRAAILVGCPATEVHARRDNVEIRLAYIKREQEDNTRLEQQRQQAAVEQQNTPPLQNAFEGVNREVDCAAYIEQERYEQAGSEQRRFSKLPPPPVISP